MRGSVESAQRTRTGESEQVPGDEERRRLPGGLAGDRPLFSEDPVAGCLRNSYGLAAIGCWMRDLSGNYTISAMLTTQFVKSRISWLKAGIVLSRIDGFQSIVGLLGANRGPVRTRPSGCASFKRRSERVIGFDVIKMARCRTQLRGRVGLERHRVSEQEFKER